MTAKTVTAWKTAAAQTIAVRRRLPSVLEARRAQEPRRLLDRSHQRKRNPPSYDDLVSERTDLLNRVAELDKEHVTRMEGRRIQRETYEKEYQEARDRRARRWTLSRVSLLMGRAFAQFPPD